MWTAKHVERNQSSHEVGDGSPQDNARPEHYSHVAVGRKLAAEGRHAESLRQFEQYLHISPESALAYRLAAEQALSLGDITLAQDYLALALHYSPSDSASAVLLVQTCIDGTDYPRANHLVRKFLDSQPDNPDLLFQAARCDYWNGHFQLARTGLSRLLELRPEHVAAPNLLGLILAREFGDLETGEKLIRRALLHAPEFRAAWSNLGWIVSERGDIEQALGIFDRILAQDGSDNETRLMRAHANLKHGRFESGWKDFESRHASPLAVGDIHRFPRLSCEMDIKGVSVLVYEEQGLGDQVMFSSCVPDLVASGAMVTIQCDPRLKALFARSFPGCRVITRNESLPAGIDYKIAIGSLPGLYRNRLADFPFHQGYLQADSQKVLHWRSKLRSLGSGPYIGISWRGGVQVTRQQLRSIPLADWEGLLDGPGQFVSLQYGDCSEIESLKRSGRPNLHHWPEAISDYDDTAALVLALDTVVSVCTSVVHLAGALGVKVCVLTPSQPEWRYLYQGDSLPWYPSVRLFRQHANESWQAVMSRLVGAMRLNASEEGR
jgi:tetratricopeptide (TPR) repeat protein